jgi:hypothetical protein
MLDALRSFGRTFIQSLSDPAFYREVHHGGRRGGLGYVYGLLFCSTLLTMSGLFALTQIVGWWSPEWSLTKLVTKAEEISADVFPAELTLTFEDGKLRTEPPEAYAIALPRAEPNSPPPRKPEERVPTNLLVIDTSARLEDFDEQDTIALLTETHFAARQDRKDLRVFAYRDVLPPEKLVIDRAWYEDLRSTLLPYLRQVPDVVRVALIAGIIVVPPVAAAFGLAGTLLWLLFPVSILWVINRWFGPKLRFGQLYRLTLPAVTLSVLWGWVSWLIPGIGMLPATLVVVAWMMYILSELKSHPHAKPTHA